MCNNIKDEAQCFVYMLRCGDDSLYTGWTNDIKGRVRAHKSGRGAKYTKSHLPVELVYTEEFLTKQEAMKREAAIKKLSRAEKLLLINKI
ncbi:MAG: GIY-YIG nuclease family protein [Hydrogenoanaerobacterium sp.]